MELLDIQSKCYYRALRIAAMCIEKYPVRVFLITYNNTNVEHAESMVFMGGAWQKIVEEDGRYYADNYHYNPEQILHKFTLIDYIKWLDDKFQWSKDKRGE
jgi:hypothetical protein